jgi:LysM repeat protein
VRFTPTRPNTPVAGALLIEPVSDVTPAATYTVKSGDNLWTIARKNNLTLAQLTAANRLSPNVSLRPGQKLIIPKSTPTATPAPAPGGVGAATKPAEPLMVPPADRSGSDVVKHVVKSGETLGAIARRYDVRMVDIAVANNISDPGKLRPGMELVIPGWKPAGSKSGKAAKTSNGTSAPAVTPPIADPLPQSTEPPPAPPVPVIRIDDNPPASSRQP